MQPLIDAQGGLRTGGGAALTTGAWSYYWLHPEGMLAGAGPHLPPAVIPSGSMLWVACVPVVALRLPPANGCDPFGIDALDNP